MVARDFVASLNRHGYAFQHAVLRRIGELFEGRQTNWHFEATEFPVAVGDSVTHIDLILGAISDVYLVGECKRVDPALSRWAFARAPYTRRNAVRDRLILEQLVPQESSKLSSAPLVMPWSREPYHIGLELRTSSIGDGSSAGRDAIERAVAQVLRGVNGLVEHYFAEDWATLKNRSFRFIPVVFTTAELWATESDLSAADLESGRLSGDGFEVEQHGWLWFNYNMSPQLQHTVVASKPGTTLPESLVAESTRSVAIVSPRGLDAFLKLDLAGGL